MSIRNCLLLSTLVFSTACSQQYYLFSYFQNNGEDGLHLAYSSDGYRWDALNGNQSLLTPAVGEDKLMRDPCIIKGPDGLYHMVWTVSWNEKGIGHAYSKDLIHWSEQQYIPVMEHEPNARNCWAPEITYDPVSKEYIIYWATTIAGKYPETEKTADRGWDHRMYYAKTLDFKEFTATKELYNHGFNVIDATIQLANDQYLMFLKDETRYPPQKNIRLATAPRIEGPYSPASNPITGDYWAEGPTAIKIDGAWVVYFDKYRKHNMGAVRSTDLKTWEDISDRVNFPEGTRHGTVFRAPRKLVKELMTLE